MQHPYVCMHYACITLTHALHMQRKCITFQSYITGSNKVIGEVGLRRGAAGRKVGISQDF